MTIHCKLVIGHEFHVVSIYSALRNKALSRIHIKSIVPSWVVESLCRGKYVFYVAQDCICANFFLIYYFLNEINATISIFERGHLQFTREVILYYVLFPLSDVIGVFISRICIFDELRSSEFAWLCSLVLIPVAYFCFLRRLSFEIIQFQ